MHETPLITFLGLHGHAVNNTIVFQSLLYYRKKLLLIHACSAVCRFFSSQATIASHHDYRDACRKMALIPPVLRQLSNLFQSGLDGFDRPSVAKLGRRLAGLKQRALVIPCQTHKNTEEMHLLMRNRNYIDEILLKATNLLIVWGFYSKDSGHLNI